MTQSFDGGRDLLDLTLVDAADAVRRGETTAVALTEASLAALKSRNGEFNVVIRLDATEALEAAEGLDRQRKAGCLLGPLHGVPLAHKDMYYQAGKPNTGGSKIRRAFVPTYTATAVERLEAAGAITVGALNMAEFAQNPTGHNAHFGHCRNPWNTAYCPGGSSSGSGVAVAARLTFGALGSDTGGSIRLPAAMCGVTGIKGTQTRVSRYGAMPLSFSMDNVGPLARTARDCARLLRTIAGHDPRDPTSSPEPVADYEAALTGDIRGLRVGVPTSFFVEDLDQDVARAFGEAVAILKSAGATVVEVALPHMDAVSTYGSIISRVEGATIHAQSMRERPGDFGSHLAARLYPGYAIPAVYYVEALARRGPLLTAFAAAVFGVADVFVAPSLRVRTPTLQETDIDAGVPGAVNAFNKVSVNMRAINYLGLPSVSVPCGFDGRGLPVGLMIQGRPFAEARVLKVADAFQRSSNWHTAKPALAA